MGKAPPAPGLFLGCITPLRYPDIEVATRHALGALGFGVVDLEGTTCCPAKASFTNVDEMAALAISARNLALAEERGVDIVTVCNGCFSVLKEAEHVLGHAPDKRAQVQALLSASGHSYKGTSRVLHLVQFLHEDVGLAKVMSSVKHSLRGMRVAIFHGCHYLRPSDVLKVDSAESPTKVQDIISALGGRSITYPGMLECCGAGGGLRARDPQTSLRIVEQRLKAIAGAEVEAIVTVCPFCFMQFDVGQSELNERGAAYSIPVLHLAQLVALAQGADPKMVARFSKTPRETAIRRIQEDGQ